MNLNASPSPFPMELISSDDCDQHHHPFPPNNQLISSSSNSSVAYHIFFNPTQDHTKYFHNQLYQSQYQEDDKYGSHEIKNKVENSGLKLSLWKKEDGGVSEVQSEKNINSVKWMSSKIRLTQKMKNPDRFPSKITSNRTTKLEDHNLQPYSSLEIDLSSNNSSYNNSSSSSSIRVCADCNTTKTPLWRSGPKGPKSLCNACGIRQRKARRAMAAAAAARSTVVATDQPPAMKIKVQQKEKTTGKNGHVSQLKKRYKMAAADAGSPSNRQKKLCFEDFLINLSKNLTFHRVFPEDEKDAAILLMALSCGLVHG